MRLLVCGGRDFSDTEYLFWVLSEIHRRKPIELVIHGGARGADGLAGHWANTNNIPVRVFRANWEQYGVSAGPIRNQQMLDECPPDYVVAFPGGSGTADMINRSRKQGFKVICPNYKRVSE